MTGDKKAEDLPDGSHGEDDTASGGAPEEPDRTDDDGTPVENPSG